MRHRRHFGENDLAALLAAHWRMPPGLRGRKFQCAYRGSDLSGGEPSDGGDRRRGRGADGRPQRISTSRRAGRLAKRPKGPKLQRFMTRSSRRCATGKPGQKTRREHVIGAVANSRGTPRSVSTTARLVHLNARGDAWLGALGRDFSRRSFRAFCCKLLRLPGRRSMWRSSSPWTSATPWTRRSRVNEAE